MQIEPKLLRTNIYTWFRSLNRKQVGNIGLTNSLQPLHKLGRVTEGSQGSQGQHTADQPNPSLAHQGPGSQPQARAHATAFKGVKYIYIYIYIYTCSLESWRGCYKAADNKSVDAIHERSAPSWRHLSKAANKKSVDARLVLSTEHFASLHSVVLSTDSTIAVVLSTDSSSTIGLVLSTDSLINPNTASPSQVVLSSDFSISATVTHRSTTCDLRAIACRDSQRLT